MRIQTCFLAALCLFFAAGFDRAAFAAGFETSPPVIAGGAGLLAIDASGNRFVGGSFNGTLDFNPGPGEDLKSSVSGSRDGFVTRFNADGTYAWTTTFGGNPGIHDDDRILAITVSASVVYAAGTFQAFDAGFNGATGTIASGGFADGFILALDPATGAPITSFGAGNGVRLVTGESDQVCTDVIVVGSELFISGTLQNSTTIGTTTTSSATFFHDAFVAKLDPATGNPINAFSSDGVQTFGGSDDDFGGRVAVGGGAVYFGGFFNAADAGIGALGTIASAGGADGFVAALDATTGAPLTAFGGDAVLTFGGTGTSDFTGCLALSGGNLYATGRFDGNNNGFNSAGTLNTAGGYDMFIFAVNAATGAPLASFNGTGIVTFAGSQADLAGSGLIVSNSILYATGAFQSTDAGFNGTGTLASAGSYDAIFLALDPTTGAPVTAFSGDGFQQFGGTASDSIGSCLLLNGKLLIAGSFTSTNAGVGGTGTIDSTNFGGYLLELDAITGGDPFAVPPTITSALTATAAKNTPFSYEITATGTAPITFSALNLPAGLALSASTISGSPTVAGTVEIILIAENAIDLDAKVLTLTITGAGAAVPAFTSPAQATPKVAHVGEPISFSAIALDADGDFVSYNWNFNDGANASGASVSHAFSTAGTYVVTVTATDGEHSASQFVLVVVNTGTPEGVFAVAKGAIKFNFKLENKDAMSFLGTVPVTVNANVTGASVEFTVVHLTLNFVLDAKGKGGDKNNSFALSGLKKGIATKPSLPFKFASKNRNLFSSLAAAGFTNANIAKPGVPIVVPIAFSINGAGYLSSVTMTYVAAQGKTGSASKK